jgi:hypothetical protein
MEITIQFKNQVAKALLEYRDRFEGSDAQFAKRFGITAAVFSRIKSGEREKLLKDTHWLNIGRELDVSTTQRKWQPAKTQVFDLISESMMFCKQHSKAMIFVDEAEIGKTFTGRYLARTKNNVFYMDASQSRTKTEFTKALARTIGVDTFGKLADVKANIKYYLRMIDKPLVIIDEPGDLEYSAFLEVKEFWNATENVCGWFMMGADGVRKKIEDGISHRKVGYREIFSRFSGKYLSIVPTDPQERQKFYRKLISDVLSVNMKDTDKLPQIISKCMVEDRSGNMGGLRRAESLLILNS